MCSASGSGWSRSRFSQSSRRPLSALQPWPIKVLVDYGLRGTALPEAIRIPLTRIGLSDTSVNLILLAAAMSVGLFALNSALAVGLSIAWSMAGQRMVYDLAGDVFAAPAATFNALSQSAECGRLVEPFDGGQLVHLLTCRWPVDGTNSAYFHAWDDDLHWIFARSIVGNTGNCGRAAIGDIILVFWAAPKTAIALIEGSPIPACNHCPSNVGRIAGRASIWNGGP